MTTLSPEMIDAMVAAGLSAEQMAAIMKAQLAAQAAADEARRVAKREQATERQRRKRQRDRQDVTHVTRDSALQGVTERDTPSEVPPKDNNSNPPPTSPSSDPDGSAPAVAVAGDDREWLFDDGLKQLIAWGKPEKAGRSLIGKWLKNTNDNTELVRKAIQAAAERRVVVPVEWIEQGLKARMERSSEQGTRNGRTHSAARSEGTAARVAAIMGYDTEPDLHGSAEERCVSDRSSRSKGRYAAGYLDAEPDAAGVYRA